MILRKLKAEFWHLEKDWLLVKHGDKEGLIPANYISYINKHTTYTLDEYFYQDLSRKESEEYLCLAAEGNFLLCKADKKEFPIQFYFMIKTKSIVWKPGRTEPLILQLSITNIGKGNTK